MKRTGIDAATWFYGDRVPTRAEEPRIEPRAPGWFLVYGATTGPVGVCGEEKARAMLAEIKAACSARSSETVRDAGGNVLGRIEENCIGWWGTLAADRYLPSTFGPAETRSDLIARMESAARDARYQKAAA